jgi:hypothetical protein
MTRRWGVKQTSAVVKDAEDDDTYNNLGNVYQCTLSC